MKDSETANQFQGKVDHKNHAPVLFFSEGTAAGGRGSYLEAISIPQAAGRLELGRKMLH